MRCDCCALSTWQWVAPASHATTLSGGGGFLPTRPLRARCARYAAGLSAGPGLMMGSKKTTDKKREKIGGWASMQGPLGFTRPQGRSQGTARRVWLMEGILNIPARLRPHIMRPVVESQNPSRYACPPHTTDRNLPPWPVVKSVCRLPTTCLPIIARFCPSQNLPRPIQGPADPVRSALPSNLAMSTRAPRD